MPGGNLWLTVDAKHGAKAPLFDHQRLAIELNLRSGYEFTPLTSALRRSRVALRREVRRVERLHPGRRHGDRVRARRPSVALRAADQMGLEQVPPTDYECLPRRPAAAAPAPLAATGTAANPLVSPDRQARSLRRKTTTSPSAPPEAAPRRCSPRTARTATRTIPARCAGRLTHARSPLPPQHRHLGIRRRQRQRAEARHCAGGRQYSLSVIGAISPACALLNASISRISLLKSVPAVSSCCERSRNTFCEAVVGR